MSAKKPAKELRFGLVKCCIWENQTRHGQRHNVTVSRLYKNGDLWKESSQFGRDDLPLVAKAIDMAHTWIFTEGREGDAGQGERE